MAGGPSFPVIGGWHPLSETEKRAEGAPGRSPQETVAETVPPLLRLRPFPEKFGLGQCQRLPGAWREVAILKRRLQRGHVSRKITGVEPDNPASAAQIQHIPVMANGSGHGPGTEGASAPAARINTRGIHPETVHQRFRQDPAQQRNRRGITVAGVATVQKPALPGFAGQPVAAIQTRKPHFGVIHFGVHSLSGKGRGLVRSNSAS